MEEEILKEREKEIWMAGVELSDFVRHNVFSLHRQRHELRFHYEFLISRIDEYEKELEQYARNKSRRENLKVIKGGGSNEG